MEVYGTIINDEVEMHKCQKCDQELDQYLVKTHYLFCSKSKKFKNFKCGLCDKIFLQKRPLETHIKYVHEIQKDKPCSFCDRKFSYLSDLKKHVQTVHEKLKKYKCDKCDKSYTAIGHLNFHINKIHEGKPMLCDLCDQVFNQIRKS